MRRIGQFTFILFLAAALPFGASAKEKIKYLFAWDDRHPATPVMGHDFAKRITKASNGEITFSFSGPEVIRSRQQFQPMSQGVFDMNFSTPAYHMGTTAVLFAYYALPAQPAKIRSSGLWDYADKDLSRFNQKLISIPISGTECNQFQFLIKRPFDNKTEFKGMKIRANAFYKHIVEPLGGAMVNLDSSEIYAALQRGVVDGVAWPVVGMVNFKWYEVAKYRVKPRFGCAVYSVTMNLKRFNKLSKTHQGVILDQGQKMEIWVAKRFDKMNDDENAQLAKFGVKETTIDKKRFDALIRSRNKGLWDLAQSFKGSTKHVKGARAIARKAGLAD
tara:strand:+ start:83 stop:1078 length:996 start_codon:yes stop_codon:yes gene_type:complete